MSISKWPILKKQVYRTNIIKSETKPGYAIVLARKERKDGRVKQKEVTF